MLLSAILISFTTRVELTIYTDDQLLSLRDKAAVLCPDDCVYAHNSTRPTSAWPSWAIAGGRLPAM